MNVMRSTKPSFNRRALATQAMQAAAATRAKAKLDLGSLPWRNEPPAARRESRRLSYVGLTRARDEIHMLYSGFADTPRGRMHWGRSPFLDELEERMQEAEGDE